MAYTWLGASGARALRGDGFVQLILALSLLAILSATPVLAKRFRQS
jgi:hypothetical protein